MANEATEVFLLFLSLSLGMDSEMLPSKQRASKEGKRISLI